MKQMTRSVRTESVSIWMEPPVDGVVAASWCFHSRMSVEDK